MSERKAGDVCLKCGESRGAINRERLICWDGHDELGKHQFKPLTPEPIIIRTDGKTIEARPCSKKHRDYFAGGYLVLSCGLCKLTRLDESPERTSHE